MVRVVPGQLELELARAEVRPMPVRASRSRHEADSASRAAAAQLLETPDALLTRSHLRALGLERRAVDAVFRALPVVALPGYSRPMIRAHDYVELVADNTYRGDRVRPFPSTARKPQVG
jgi:hypothetical protein